MIKVIGVRFRNVGKIYYFSPQEFDIYTGDHVIVETARGIEYGTVVLAPREVEEDKIVQPLKDVLRVATPEDDEQEASNRSKEREAFRICLEKIRNHNLEMKLIDAEYTFDNNKVLFYFTADGRIDFRELVKDLASVFKTRIELRQIGVRDETKILGGIGICGRALCCHTYLSEFAPVSIKMAKEQNLSLNPTKISGTCGRLMCCLKNEQETYEYLNGRLPSIGDVATTPSGLIGEVQSVNVLRQLVKVLVQVDKDEVDLQEYKVDELTFQFKGKKDKAQKEETILPDAISEDMSEDIAELELLEEQEYQEKKSSEGQAEKKPYEKQHDRKSGDRKYKDRKSQDHKYDDHKSQDHKYDDHKSQDHKSDDHKPQGKKHFEKKPYDRKFHDKKSQDRNQEKYQDKNKEIPMSEPSAVEDGKDANMYDANVHETKNHEHRPYDKKNYERRPQSDRRYKKYKDRGREKQNDSNVTSE